MTHFLPRRLPRPRLHGRRAAGLSLLEMLLVIALIAAIGLITAAGLSRGKRFPRLALQMIQVGEESGALDTMLLKAADTFEQDSARRIDRLLAAMVPAITLVLASVVGAVIVAVLVPLYDLTNAIG